MTEPTLMMTVASFAALIVVTIAALKGWRDWIGLQRLSLEGRRTRPDEGTGAANPMARIELADLKERVRKLEAIAAGVDL
jgi:hypothetical protein